MEREDSRPDSFITVAFVFILIILRILSESIHQAILIVAIINLMMLAYVFYLINKDVAGVLLKRKSKNQIFKTQYIAYCKTRNWIIKGSVVAAIIYCSILYSHPSLDSVWGCVNDCIAFITFGLSVEDNKIISKLKKYYMDTDFSHSIRK